MRRAYERAGWQPHDVDLIECHATGTPVGDAVEFESLRELWGNGGWAPGQCAIGSVKSTVGHLLTGAGAAAVAKVLKAMEAEERPPEANFTQPAAGLDYADGPFRVLAAADRWSRRSPLEPRRAAVSGFGFGGVNAHLLLEEWTGIPVPRSSPPVATGGLRPPEPAVPVAVVGMAAHFGPWGDLRAFQERVLGGDSTSPAPKRNGWGLASEPCPPGYYIEELRFPTDRFRIPPKELEETLPQQLLMLQVAAAALDDCRASGGRQPPESDDPTTGVFVGLGLDPNTTNFHLRWAALAGSPEPRSQALPGNGGPRGSASRPDQDERQSLSPVRSQAEPGNEDNCAPSTEYSVLGTRYSDASPPLTANRVMGALGSIAASRIARAFHLGGPSHTVCSEEGSAARALERAVRALQAGEID